MSITYHSGLLIRGFVSKSINLLVPAAFSSLKSKKDIVGKRWGYNITKKVSTGRMDISRPTLKKPSILFAGLSQKEFVTYDMHCLHRGILNKQK